MYTPQKDKINHMPVCRDLEENQMVQNYDELNVRK